jgi:hypothetical protein
MSEFFTSHICDLRRQTLAPRRGFVGFDLPPSASSLRVEAKPRWMFTSYLAQARSTKIYYQTLFRGAHADDDIHALDVHAVGEMGQMFDSDLLRRYVLKRPRIGMVQVVMVGEVSVIE